MIRHLPLAVVISLAGLASAQTATPYAGQETRDIKALSEAQITGLRTGAGLGYALSAELNGLPGPLHVLELADTLELDAEQRAEVQAIYENMRQEAQALGAALIKAEAGLDAAFAGKSLTARDIRMLTAQAAEIEGQLRAVHLTAHLQTAPLLNKHQVMLYSRARGYDEGHHGHGQGHGHTDH